MWPKYCKLRGLDSKEYKPWLAALLKRPVIGLKDVGRVAEFTAVLAELNAWLKPADFNGQVKLANMGRTNLLHKIQNEQVMLLAVFMAGQTAVDRMTGAEHYIVAIIRSKFNREDPNDLSDHQLNQLRFTVARSIDGKRRKALMSVADLHARAGIQNPDAPQAAPEPEPSAEEVVAAFTTGGEDTHDPEW